MVELRSAWWTRCSACFKGYLTDVLLGFGYLGLSTGVLLMMEVTPVVRAAVGLPLVVFVPGYGVVTALFPARFEDTTSRAGLLPRTPQNSPTLTERIAISFGSAIAVVPVFGLGLTAVGIPLSRRPIVVVLATFSGLGLLVGAVRRARLDADRRFRLPFTAWASGLKRSVDEQSQVETTINVMLGLSVLASALLLGYGLLGTTVAETDTSMVVLTENDAGALVASGYPDTLSVDETAAFTVAVRNGEGDRVPYTLVSELQRVDASGSDLEVERTQRVLLVEQEVRPNGKWYAKHRLSPDLTGRNLRLTYFLYRGQAPPDPSVESSYRHTYLWLNVTDERRP
jgi:uncharacterized membrane protein